MFTLSAGTYAELTRVYFMRQIRQFLLQNSLDAALVGLLQDSENCFGFWRPLLAGMERFDEQSLALRLSFALVCKSRGIAKTLPETGEEGEIEMKIQLERWGVLRFSAFDQ